MLQPFLRILLIAPFLILPSAAMGQPIAPPSREAPPHTIDDILAAQPPSSPELSVPPPGVVLEETAPPVAVPPRPDAPPTPPTVESGAAPTDGQAPPALSDIPSLNPADVLAVEYTGGPLPEGFSLLTLKLQILLDQSGMSPGIIDGTNGRNVAKAIAGVETLMGLPVDGVLDDEVWRRLPLDTPVLLQYEITPDDVAGPFLPSVPTDYGEMAKLDALSYTGPLEMFGERFHMDVDLLTKLNPGADFGQPGTKIVVAGANAYAVQTPVVSLIADKENAQLRGYDAEGKLVVAYPATIGSDELPSPSGTHAVNGIAHEAAYYYNPKLNFKQGDNDKKLKLPPGPNNPVGTTWIDLTEPTYGIHGTPEPSKIDKTRSHGCIRLTNWDVQELAELVKKGVPVEFR